MSTTTANIKLTKIDPADFIDIKPFNDNADILDKEIGDLKKSNTDLAATQTETAEQITTINKALADQEKANEAYTQKDKDLQGAIDAVQAAVDKKAAIDDTAKAATTTWSSEKIVDEIAAKVSVPPGGTKGQVLAKKSDADGDVQWQDNAGIQGAFGGEVATKADLLATSKPQVGFNYIVTADESQNGKRTYYYYALGGVWQYMGAFSDGAVEGGGSGGGYSRQWNSPDVVTTGAEQALAIANTSTFVVMPPAVLQLEAGETDIVKVAADFADSEAAALAYDSDHVSIANSKMQLKTAYQVACTNGDQYAESDWIDAAQYKSIESIILAS